MNFGARMAWDKPAAVDSGGRNGDNIGKKRGGRQRSPLTVISHGDKPSSLSALAVYFCFAMARIKKIKIKIKTI